MVAVDDDGGVCELRVLLVELTDQEYILIVVVGVAVALLVHIAPQNSMGIGIALGVDLPAPVYEGVLILGSGDGVHHHRQVSGGGVLHAHGDLNAAGGEAVLLILHGAGAHGHIAQDVVQVFIVLGVQHLVGAGEAGLPDHPHVHLPDGNEALEHVRLVARVGLMEHALVALAGSTGLVCVAAGDDEYLLLHFLLYLPQPLHIVHDAVGIIGGAGAYYKQEPVIPAGEYLLQLYIPLFKASCHLAGERVHLLDLGGDGELAYKFHVHRPVLLICGKNCAAVFHGGHYIPGGRACQLLKPFGGEGPEMWRFLH